VDIATPVLTFYLPVAFVTTIALAGVMRTTRVQRWAGSLFIGLYMLFVIGGWFM
jgi:hypothetical protein